MKNVLFLAMAVAMAMMSASAGTMTRPSVSEKGGVFRSIPPPDCLSHDGTCPWPFGDGSCCRARAKK